MKVVIDLQEKKYHGDAESGLPSPKAAITEVPHIGARICCRFARKIMKMIKN